MPKSASVATERILSFSLAELPSSQHRSGLAALVLLCQRLSRSKREGLCEILELTKHGAKFRFDEAGIAKLFDEMYAASEELQPQETARKDQDPHSVEEREDTDPKTGKVKIKKVYYYPQVVPKGSLLEEYDTSESKTWVKLYRDMLWTILRGVPATRKPFEDRAGGIACKDYKIAWEQINKDDSTAVELPSTYFIGAQSANAEGVSFLDKARFQFLLHFWPLVAQIFVPTALDRDGKRSSNGLVICVPDVSDLKNFCHDYLTVLKNRGNEVAGYRPREALIDLPEEAGLVSIQRLKQAVETHTGRQQTADLVFGFDILHTRKDGNNVRLLYCTSVDPVPERDDCYARLKPLLRYTPFRRQRLHNLFHQRPWYYGFDKLLSELSLSTGLLSTFFANDARTSFDVEPRLHEDRSMTNMTTHVAIEPLILRIVEDYVRQKLRDKYKLEWKEVQGTPREREYSEKKEAIIKDAFYAIRSRTSDDDFRSYFASTLCSVPHWMSQPEYIALTECIYDTPDKIRTLSMLALSARVTSRSTREGQSDE